MNLRHLNLTRNWFNTMPSEIGSLVHLLSVDASRNFFRPNGRSLRFDALRALPCLQTLDLVSRKPPPLLFGIAFSFSNN